MNKPGNYSKSEFYQLYSSGKKIKLDFVVV